MEIQILHGGFGPSWRISFTMEDFIEGTGFFMGNQTFQGDSNPPWKMKSSVEDEILHGGFH